VFKNPSDRAGETSHTRKEKATEKEKATQGERIKLHANYRPRLDSDKCTTLRFSGHLLFCRRNAWLLLLTLVRSASTFGD
jgi:hypothetical protein